MENFYDVVNRLCDLYISYRQRYVVMQAAPELEAGYRIYMPKSSSGPVKLTNRAVCQHLNRQIAISVRGEEADRDPDRVWCAPRIDLRQHQRRQGVPCRDLL